MKSSEPIQNNGVEAVECALAILIAFQHRGERLSLAEVAKRTGLNKSRILRLGASLERMGFITRNASGQFGLGAELPRLADLYESDFDLEKLVRPQLVRLVEATKETAALYVLDANERVCKFRENSPRTIRHHLDEGMRLPLNVGAAGKILLAFSDPQNPNGSEIRKRGWYVSLGERNPEAAAIAIPLLDSTNRLWGALSVSGLRMRFTKAAQRQILQEIRFSADVLSTRLPAPQKI